MFKRVRRWHFDVALFLGLALFSWAYWYSKPRPIWTQTVHAEPGTNVELDWLGYSTDGHVFYSKRQLWKDKWLAPIIEFRSVATGDVLEQHEVQLTPDEQAILATAQWQYDRKMDVMLSSDRQYLQLRIFAERREILHRLSTLQGQPAGAGFRLSNLHNTMHLADLSSGTLKLGFARDFKQGGSDLFFLDMATGKRLQTIDRPEGRALYNIVAIPGGRYVAAMWKSMSGPAGVPQSSSYLVQIIQLSDYTPVASVVLEDTDLIDICMVSEKNWLICQAKQNPVLTTKLLCYQFDPESRKLTEDPQKLLHGKVSQPHQWWYPHPPYLTSTYLHMDGETQQNSFMHTIRNWLAKIGIHRTEAYTSKYEVADLQTGEPLRQVTGVPGGLYLSWDKRYLIGETHPGLVGYEVPHHLWEKSLSWMQWLSWLLVFPWPLRYLALEAVHSPRRPESQPG